MPSDLDAKLQKRKLDALKRGIHRMRAEDSTPFSVHVVGVGKAGLRSRRTNAPRSDGLSFV